MLFSNYSQNIFYLQNSGRDSRYAVYGYIQLIESGLL